MPGEEMNYETRAVLRWIDNDADVSAYWRERAEEIKGVVREHPILDLSDELEANFVEEDNPLMEAGLYTDLLYSALSNVSWDEIAELIFIRLEEV